MATRRRRTQHGSQYARVLASLGTLAHNRAFTAQDARDYVRHEGISAPQVDAALRYFKRKGWIAAGDRRGELYPTKKGWRAVEKASRISKWPGWGHGKYDKLNTWRG